MGIDFNNMVIDFIKENGPVLPSEVGKCIGKDIIISAAILSDLVSRKLVMISKAKIGGSPIYYLSGQQEKLERLYPSLNEKDRQTYDMLKNQGVIEDSAADPLTRVSLRVIKDFAIPFFIGEKQFWRWYLLPETQAETQAKVLMSKEEKFAEKKEVFRIQSAPISSEKKEPFISAPGISISSRIESAIKTSAILITKEEKGPEKPKPEHQKQAVKKKERDSKLIAPVAGENLSYAIEEKAEKEEKKEKAKPVKKQFLDDEFFLKINEFFSMGSIEKIESINPARKSEYDFIIKIPSNVGSLKYFCRARKKASINEDDLSSAYVQAQMRKLPVLFITPGKLTKRASEILARDFRTMIVRNL